MSEPSHPWEKFLHPETLKSNLINISLFIAAFESFKRCVIDKPKTLFMNGIDVNGMITDPDYQTEVLSKNRSVLHASLLWIKAQGGLDQSDLDKFDAIRKHRNELVHQPTDFLLEQERNFDPSKFTSLVQLLEKIERWWFEWFEMAVNPDILPDGANLDDVIPGPLLMLQLLLDVALGGEPEDGYYYRELMRQQQSGWGDSAENG